MSKQLIILDRDGCVNKAAPEGACISQLSEFEVFEDVIETLTHPISHQFQFAIATNQQGIAKGLYSLNDVYQLHYKFLELIGRDISTFPIFVCIHFIGQLCECRKPKPGLLLDAIEHFKLTPNDAMFIGDKESDANAAKAAGVDFLFCSRNPKKDSRSTSHNYGTISKLSTNLLESLLS